MFVCILTNFSQIQDLEPITYFTIFCYSLKFRSTIKPVYNDHPWDLQKVAVLHNWLLCRGFLMKIAL